MKNILVLLVFVFSLVSVQVFANGPGKRNKRKRVPFEQTIKPNKRDFKKRRYKSKYHCRYQNKDRQRRLIKLKKKADASLKNVCYVSNKKSDRVFFFPFK